MWQHVVAITLFGRTALTIGIHQSIRPWEYDIHSYGHGELNFNGLTA